jgi:hypothetical protein
MTALLKINSPFKSQNKRQNKVNLREKKIHICVSTILNSTHDNCQKVCGAQ